MESDPRELIEYDIRGQICPSTLLTALHRVNLSRKELRSGGVRLGVVADGRDSTTTIPEAIRNMEYAVTVSIEGSSHFLACKGAVRSLPLEGN